MVVQIGADRRQVAHHGNPISLRCAAGPMPDSRSSCGEPYTPPETITSPLARAVSRPFGVRYSTPTARPSSIRIRVACALGVTTRFFLPRAGFRYATAALQRRPLPTVVW